VLAAKNKCLAPNNRSRTGGEATKKHELGWMSIPMKPTTKIRFTEPQIALLMHAHPNCNLDCLTELCFEFDQAGKIIDCTGISKQSHNINHDYAGSGLAHLCRAARRRLTAGPPSATILQFPNAAIK
jgi:hypothetical protein